MNTGICPKCGSEEIYYREGIIYRLVPLVSQLRIGAARPHMFVCKNCGFFEEYILDRNFLDKLPNKWKKVKR